MTPGEPLPRHLRTFARFAALTGARPAPELPPGPGDTTERFLALAVDRGMFRAETNLRFIIGDVKCGTRLVHLGAGSESAIAEAGRLAGDYAAAHPELSPPVVRAGTTDAGRVPYVEVAAPPEPGAEGGEALICKPPRVLSAYFDAGVLPEALAIASDLRRAGVACWFFHEVKNLAKHLRLADRFGAEWVVILGGREWDTGCVALRHASSREEVAVRLGDAVGEVLRRVPREEHGA